MITIEGRFDPNMLIDKQLKFAWAYLKSYGFDESDFERRDGFEIYSYSDGNKSVQLYAKRTGFFPDYWPVVKIIIKETNEK